MAEQAPECVKFQAGASNGKQLVETSTLHTKINFVYVRKSSNIYTVHVRHGLQTPNAKLHDSIPQFHNSFIPHHTESYGVIRHMASQSHTVIQFKWYCEKSTNELQTSHRSLVRVKVTKFTGQKPGTTWPEKNMQAVPKKSLFQNASWFVCFGFGCVLVSLAPVCDSLVLSYHYPLKKQCP